MGRNLILAFVVLFSGPVCAFDFKEWVGGLAGSLPKDCKFTRASEGVRIVTDDPDYPLEFVEECYKFIRHFDEPVINKKTGDLLYNMEKSEWRWKYVVKNKSDDKLAVLLNYKLTDKDGFVLADYGTLLHHAAPNSTETITGIFIMDRDMAHKVNNSSWSIGYAIPVDE